MTQEGPKSGELVPTGSDGTQSPGTGAPLSAPPPFQDPGVLGAIVELAGSGGFDSVQSNRLFAGVAGDLKLERTTQSDRIADLERRLADAEDRFHIRDVDARLLEKEVDRLKVQGSLSKILLTLATVVGGIGFKLLKQDYVTGGTLLGVAALLALFGYAPQVVKTFMGFFQR